MLTSPPERRAAVRRVRPRGGGPLDLRPTRWAVSAFFFIAGFAFATWAARVPAIQDQLDLAPRGLTIAFLGLSGGAVGTTLVAGAAVRRYGSHRVLGVGVGVYLVSLPLLAWAPALLPLTAGLAVFAAGNTFLDVAMNAQGLLVERRYGRPILSGMHAIFSLGALAGGAAGSLAALWHVDVRAHFTGTAIALAAVAVAAARHLPSRDVTAASKGRVPRRRGVLLLAGALCFGALMSEGVLNDWGAVFLHDVAGTGPAVAAAGFALFSAGMVAGRLAGDHLRRRLDPTRLLGLCVATALCGSALAVVRPAAGTMLAGYILLGLGLAAIVPVTFASVAGADPERSAGVIAAVSAIGYLGFLAGPAVLGTIASLSGLRAAMLTLPAVCLVMAVLIPRLRAM